MTPKIPQLESLALDDVKPATIVAMLKSVQEVTKELNRLKEYALAVTFARYFHENPEAVLYVNGQVGEYNDEGYEGCWVARVDAEYVREKATNATSGKTSHWRGNDTNYQKDARKFNNSGGDHKDHDVLPNDLYGLRLTEFDAVSSCSGLDNAWSSVGDFMGNDRNGGMVYEKKNWMQIMNRIGLRDATAHEIMGLIEHESLVEHVDAKPKKTRKRSKVL
jgi:hypothetical protein